jgi:hypothetical protein
LLDLWLCEFRESLGEPDGEPGSSLLSPISPADRGLRITALGTAIGRYGPGGCEDGPRLAILSFDVVMGASMRCRAMLMKNDSKPASWLLFSDESIGEDDM